MGGASERLPHRAVDDLSQHFDDYTIMPPRQRAHI